jgi:hypothetical protein
MTLGDLSRMSLPMTPGRGEKSSSQFLIEFWQHHLETSSFGIRPAARCAAKALYLLVIRST